MKTFINRLALLASTAVATWVLLGCAHVQKQEVVQAVQAVQAPDAAYMTKEKQVQMTPDMALQMLKEGNARYVSGNLRLRDIKTQIHETGEDGQFPFASIVSCIDSRAAPTQIFDQGVGDLFSARVAANIVNEDILGSLEYTTKVAGAKLIVIVGHTHCGGIKGACDDAKLGNLTQLVGKIRASVLATPDQHGADRTSKNHYFVDAVAETNVHDTIKTLLAKSPILREMVEQGKIKVVGAMLDVETGVVRFL